MVHIFTDVDWYLKASPLEQVFTGVLKPQAPEISSVRKYEYRLIIDENESFPVYVGSRCEDIQSFAGKEVRIKGKLVIQHGVSKTEEIWPATVELLEEKTTQAK